MNNIYLFAGNSYMIKKNTLELKKSLDIQNEQLNVATFRDMPSVEELKDACNDVPFMADYRLVVLSDTKVLAAKGNADEGKMLADYLERLPQETVLVMCIDGKADKRRVLYKQIKKLGIIKEYADPKPNECAAFAINEAKQAGVEIKNQVANELVGITSCDYYTISNEIKKLAIYCDEKEILSKHIKACVSRSLEYDVFEMHSLFVKQKAKEASQLLQDILTDQRPEALIGLIAYNIREMYKVKVMLDLSYSIAKIASSLKSRDFIIKRRAQECKRFSQTELRQALILLSDLDYGTKSGKCDSMLSLPTTLFQIYKV